MDVKPLPTVLPELKNLTEYSRGDKRYRIYNQFRRLGVAAQLECYTDQSFVSSIAEYLADQRDFAEYAIDSVSGQKSSGHVDAAFLVVKRTVV
jgi:hypothetical protein